MGDEMPPARVVSINVSGGGVPKLPVPEAAVGLGGLAGDRQRNLEVHGGPERAVSLFSAERIAALAADGHPITPGSTGENLTIFGLDWDAVVPGALLSVGAEGAGVRLQITSYATPCRNVEASFADGRFGRISQKAHPGWSRVYARVLAPGVVRTGDAVTLARPPA